MTSGPSGTGTGSRRGLLVGGALLALVLLVAVFAGGSSGRISGPPLSRRAQGEDGLRGLVLLLESYRATAHEVGAEPPAGTSTAVLAEDRLDDASRNALRAWVEEGNTLVVLDDSSPLAASQRGSIRSTVDRGVCDIPGIDAESIDVSAVHGVDLPVAARYEVEPGDRSCFGDGTSAFVVARPVGDGTVVSVGSPRPFVNSALGKSDNAALAVELLAPEDGADVAFIEANAIGAGQKKLVDLISDRVFQALIELVIAFVLYAVWRARRLGRPVPEVQPVAIAASGLVRAVGRLRLRSRSTAAAAESIRIDTRRFLAQRYGLVPGTPSHVIADVTADRTELTADQVLLAIDDRPILDEAGLVALTRQIDKVRQEALSGGRTVRG